MADTPLAQYSENFEMSLGSIESKGRYPMPNIPSFYSIREANKPIPRRIYHNNSACPCGREIEGDERRKGTCNYRLCDDCEQLNRQGR